MIPPDPSQVNVFDMGDSFESAMMTNALMRGQSVMPTPYGPMIFGGGGMVDNGAFYPGVPGSPGGFAGTTTGTNALAGGVPNPKRKAPPGSPTSEYVSTIDDNDPRRGMMGTGASTAAYSTDFGFELDGKRRPNKPDMAVINAIGQAAEQTLGKGSRVVIFSGQENPGDQHGSNRHKTGLAADVRVYDPQGNLVTPASPQGQRLMVSAARNGIKGIGGGAPGGYMGGNAFHFDMVPHEDYSAGQGPVWGGAAKQNREQILGAMGL